MRLLVITCTALLFCTAVIAHSMEIPVVIYDLRPVDRITWVCEDSAARIDSTQKLELREDAKQLINEACKGWMSGKFSVAQQRARQAFRVQSNFGFAKMIDFELRLRANNATQADSFARSLVRYSRLDKSFSVAWQADHYFERHYYEIGSALTEKLKDGYEDYKLYAQLIRAILRDDPAAESILNEYVALRALKTTTKLDDVRHQLSELIQLDDSFSAPIDYSKNRYVDKQKLAEEAAKAEAELAKLPPHTKRTRALLKQLSSFEMPEPKTLKK